LRPSILSVEAVVKTERGEHSLTINSTQSHFDQQLAQLKLVPMLESLGHIRVQPFAIKQGTVGASQIFYHDHATSPKYGGVFAGDTAFHGKIIRKIYFGEDILRRVAASQPDWFYE